MFYTIQLLEFFWQWRPNLSWPTTILRDFLHVIASLLGYLQIDVEALVKALLAKGLAKVVHIHVAAVAQLLVPHVIDHGVKLHFQPPCNFDMGMSIWPFSTKTKVPYQTYNLTNFAFGRKSQNDIPMH